MANQALAIPLSLVVKPASQYQMLEITKLFCRHSLQTNWKITSLQYKELILGALHSEICKGGFIFEKKFQQSPISNDLYWV